MPVETDLQAAPVGTLDLSEYTTVAATATIRETLTALRTERHNCAFILDGDTLIGIFTDRDVLTKLADGQQADHLDQSITTVMTRNPMTVDVNASTHTAMQLMEANRFRNVPVLADGRVVGNLTHFSIIRYLADRVPQATYNLPPNPNLAASGPYGG